MLCIRQKVSKCKSDNLTKMIYPEFSLNQWIIKASNDRVSAFYYHLYVIHEDKYQKLTKTNMDIFLNINADQRWSHPSIPVHKVVPPLDKTSSHINPDQIPVYLVYTVRTLGYTDDTLAYTNTVQWPPSVYTGCIASVHWSYTGSTTVYAQCTLPVYVKCIH